MVTPYLSRLSPAGPGLRPRPRSRFEPAPTFPIDGPAVASLGLSVPPAEVTEPGEAEAEWDSPDRRSADPATAADSGRELPPARTAAPGAAAPLREPMPAPGPGTARPPPPGHIPVTTPAAGGRPRTPAPEAPTSDGGPTPAPGPGTARPPGPDRTPATAPAPAPGGHRVTPARTAAPGPATPGQERPPSAAVRTASSPRPAPGPATGDSTQPAVGNTQPAVGQPADFQLASAVSAGGAFPSGRAAGALSRPEPLPPPGPSPAERPGQAADGPAERVQTMARWLRDADVAATRAEGPPGPSIRPQPARPGRVAGWPDQAVQPDVTVTIGRIEVTAPAPEPAPARPRPGEPRRRVPSLDDYLESRARARGRPG